MKLKINSWKIYRNVQIKQHTVKQPKGSRKITRKIIKCLETNKNDNTTCENV